MTKKRQFPHTLVILMILMLFCVLLTWIVPAGEFERVKNEAGVTVVVANSFHYTESKAINPFLVPSYIIKGFGKGLSLILMILFSGCAFEVITESGALHSVISKAVKKLANKEAIFIPVLSLVCAAISSNQSQNIFIGFAPILVMAAKAMGFDSITGLAIIVCGGGVGWATGTVSAASTGTAQQIAELPLFSGMWYRVLLFVLLEVITDIVLIRYARKVKKDPSLSPMYDLDKEAGSGDIASLDSYGEMNGKKWAILLSLAIALILMIYGGICWAWDMDMFASVFIYLGIVAGVIAGFSPNQIAKCFVSGAKKVLGSIMIIGCARTVSVILTAGGILDTTVNALAVLLMKMPRGLQGIMMFYANYLVNFFVTSGSGQAAIVMPVFTPVADMIGMTRQTAVLAFVLGDGFSNYIYPTCTSLMALTSAVGIPYDRWVRFVKKPFLMWTIVCSIAVFAAQMMSYGPF